MKCYQNLSLFLILILLFSYSECTDNSNEKYSYQVKFIDVPLDHFNYVSNVTFPLKYLINDSFTENETNTPIFFYTGNEGDIELFADNTGFLWDLAIIYKGLVVFAEHRYYGKSLPFGNASFDNPNHSGYLTVEQALADYAQLLDQLMIGNRNRPVIAIGGSYGGMLAAWFRMKYPHIVTGALAASAPVRQFVGITECNIFARIATSVFQTALNNNCSANIKKSWGVFNEFAKTDDNRAFLNKVFNFCDPLKKPEDIDSFFEYLEDVYGNLAMANYPYDNSFLAPLPAYPVRQFCMYHPTLYDGKELIQAMQNSISVYSNFTGKTKCLDHKSAYEPSLGRNAWEIQTCNEIVMPMCSTGENDMFRKKEWNFKEYSDKCVKKYQIKPKEREIIIRYGADNLNFASNIIFSNGLLDPWSGGGVLRSTNSEVFIVIIPEGAHHIDLRASNPKDPQSVREARKMETEIIKRWITSFYRMKY